MNDILITFLGRVPRTENGYRTTVYSFANNEQSEPVAFFGWSLRDRLKPKRILVLGTAGSMWDHLFESDIDFAGEDEDNRLALIDEVSRQQVTQQRLDAMAPLLERSLDCEVRLRIIPYCRQEEEQVELLHIMAEEVSEGENVHLDITHGFRHLPMLALLSALHLQMARQATVSAIWYAAYDPDTGNAPVYDLSGLLRIAGWLQALTAFDKDGDYRVFAPLLGEAGLGSETVSALKVAGYHENILNVGAATGELRKVLGALHEGEALAPEARLLLPHVKKRLDWVAEERQFEKQQRLACKSLERGDYLRATLYAFEAVITRLCQINKVDINNFSGREQVRRNYEDALTGINSREAENYFLLKRLRNQLAHGTRGHRGEIQQIILNEQKLRTVLRELLGAIESGDLPRPK